MRWGSFRQVGIKRRCFHVHLWHLADNQSASAFVRYWNNNGQRSILAYDGLFAFDPKRTLRNVHLAAAPEMIESGRNAVVIEALLVMTLRLAES